jgi:Poxvirus Late Transcription Factor VLTF3 like
MHPIRMEDDVAVFSTDQVADYGEPCLYGYEKYIVVESRGLNLTMDYSFEQSRVWKAVHRYDRVARFKYTLLNLLGERTNIPRQVLAIVKTYLHKSTNPWNDTRKILKHYKFRKYYDQIPSILRQIGYDRFFPLIHKSKIEAIVNDFKTLVYRYDQIKQSFKRIYFPNLRYIALKLLKFHSIESQYKIPFIRTKRKNKILESIWNSLI